MSITSLNEVSPKNKEEVQSKPKAEATSSFGNSSSFGNYKFQASASIQPPSTVKQKPKLIKPLSSFENYSFGGKGPNIPASPTMNARRRLQMIGKGKSPILL